jgi:hypothetical protein
MAAAIMIMDERAMNCQQEMKDACQKSNYLRLEIAQLTDKDEGSEKGQRNLGTAEPQPNLNPTTETPRTQRKDP